MCFKIQILSNNVNRAFTYMKQDKPQKLLARQLKKIGK